MKGSDLLADLALLGPVDASQGGVSLASQERLGVGQDAFLIGFQVATEELPQLTISRRAVAGIREFESTGIAYLQTDSFLSSDDGEKATSPDGCWFQQRVTCWASLGSDR